MDTSRLRRTESRFEAADGRPLFRRAWLPEEPRRALVIVHGFAEHSGRYDALGEWFAARGSAVHAYDMRGHGRSGGARGYVRSFDEYLDDLDRFVAVVREESPGLPVSVIGHSMGGLTVAAFLRERRPDVRAAVTSGAALGVQETAPRAQVRLARALRRIAPRLAFSAGLDPQGLSRDPEVVRRYESDPLVFRRITASLAAELFDASARTAKGGAEVAVPVLVLHGDDDPICPPAGSRGFHASLPPGEHGLRIYPGLRHEIFNEPEAAEVYGDVLDWLDARGA